MTLTIEHNSILEVEQYNKYTVWKRYSPVRHLFYFPFPNDCRENSILLLLIVSHCTRTALYIFVFKVYSILWPFPVIYIFNKHFIRLHVKHIISLKGATIKNQGFSHWDDVNISPSYWDPTQKNWDGSLQASTRISLCERSPLFQVISRLGIPKEILIDWGMSFITHELYELVGIKEIHTSVSHPLMEGLLEHFKCL